MESNYCLILEDSLTDAKLILREIKKPFPAIEHKVISSKADFFSELNSDRKISFILSDYNMPSFRGTDAYRILKQEGIDIPFLLITGSVKDEVAVEMLELGLDDYILKDRMSRLVPAIKAAIEKQRLRIERKKILDNLKESERKYSTLAEISPVGIFRKDAEGKCVYVNKKYCELTGLKEEETFGFGYFKAIHQKDKQRLRQMWSNALQTKNTSSLELRFVRPDKSIVWVFGQVTPELDEHGAVVSAVGTVTDITEKKKIERERRLFTKKLEQQVMSRTQELRMTNDKLTAKNKDVTDSINYALRLQKALFHDKSILQDFFQDAFVYLRPRDIVSGDFYWFHKKKDKFIIVAADCTGHGVPGAFMSVLGIELLDKIIVQEGASYPTHILELLDDGLLNVLGKADGEYVTDGIDISICSIDTNSKRIDFAGAGRPLVLVSDKGLRYVKGTMFGLGGALDPSIKRYETTSVNYSPGDMLYLFSDGYVDQFGGEKGKKIMMKRLKEHLINIHSLPCEEQEDYLGNFLLSWMGEEKQVDDILIMGARLM